MIDEADNGASFRRRFARSLLPELAQAHPVAQFKPMLIQLRSYFHDLTLLKFMDDTAAYKVVRGEQLKASAKVRTSDAYPVWPRDVGRSQLNVGRLLLEFESRKAQPFGRRYKLAKSSL